MFQSILKESGFITEAFFQKTCNLANKRYNDIS